MFKVFIGDAEGATALLNNEGVKLVQMTGMPNGHVCLVVDDGKPAAKVSEK